MLTTSQNMFLLILNENRPECVWWEEITVTVWNTNSEMMCI